ncbi:MAG: hypothetical protein IKH57_16380 [Clostridia bacterium]|nr:hypothetical protein [Clostridia bacterium]
MPKALITAIPPTANKRLSAARFCYYTTENPGMQLFEGAIFLASYLKEWRVEYDCPFPHTPYFYPITA